MMQFLKDDKDKAVRVIAGRICDGLHDGKRVLWLISGSSNVPIEVEAMKLVRKHAETELDHLAILPMDERYGKPDHANSTSEALRQAGFDPGAATWIDVLMHDTPFDQTLSFYSEVAATAMANAAVIIGQFGMGADAHTAGVLPDSPATEDDEANIVGYEWTDYIRMTLTPKALEQVQVAYLVAYGDGKKEALERLRANTETLAKMPAKLLYQIPEVYVYNDQLENSETKE